MTTANPAVTPIARSKTAALARILDSVPKGYIFYTAGECRAEKMFSLAQKFHQRYGIGCSPAQRLIRKQKGLANALLVIYWPTQSETTLVTYLDADAAPILSPDSELTLASPLATAPASFSSPAEAPDEEPLVVPKVAWLLLVTEGTGAVREQERLRSVLDSQRLLWLGYELVRHSARGKTSWTWRRTKREMDELYALLAYQLNRRQQAGVAETLLRICRQPGFAGVRKQSRTLCQFARSRGYAGELPFLYFIQKVKHGVPLRLAG